jgi:hypothetical protein
MTRALLATQSAQKGRLLRKWHKSGGGCRGIGEEPEDHFHSHAIIASGEPRYVEFTGQYGIIECCTEEGSYYSFAINTIGLNSPTFLDWRAALSHSYSLLRTRQETARVSAAFPVPAAFRLLEMLFSLQRFTSPAWFGHGLWPVGSRSCRRSRFRRHLET